MKKEAVQNKQIEVKPVVSVKRKSGNQVNVKKAGAAVVKKLAVDTKLPPEQQSVDSTIFTAVSETDVCLDNTEQVEVVAESKLAAVTEQPPKPQAADTATATIPKESKALRERLGLNGYITETVKIMTPIKILGCKAEGVVFAKQIAGADRVLLHVTLVDGAGKHSILSSRKKASQSEWQALTDSLTALSITWRDKELRRAVK